MSVIEKLGLMEFDQIKALRVTADSIRGVYFLFHGDEIIYIGSSNNVMGRLAAHIASRPSGYWSDTIDGYAYIETEDYEILEIAYIKKFQPKYNRQYRQVPEIDG